MALLKTRHNAMMKNLDLLDVIAGVFVVIGALNWGLVGLFQLNLIAYFLGDLPTLERSIYVVVGFAGLYQAIFLKGIQRRWSVK